MKEEETFEISKVHLYNQCSIELTSHCIAASGFILLPAVLAIASNSLSPASAMSISQRRDSITSIRSKAELIPLETMNSEENEQSGEEPKIRPVNEPTRRRFVLTPRPPPKKKLTRLQRYRQVVWNADTKEFFGRTADRWCKCVGDRVSHLGWLNFHFISSQNHRVLHLLLLFPGRLLVWLAGHLLFDSEFSGACLPTS